MNNVFFTDCDCAYMSFAVSALSLLGSPDSREQYKGYQALVRIQGIIESFIDQWMEEGIEYDTFNEYLDILNLCAVIKHTRFYEERPYPVAF